MCIRDRSQISVLAAPIAQVAISTLVQSIVFLFVVGAVMVGSSSITMVKLGSSLSCASSTSLSGIAKESRGSRRLETMAMR